MSVVSGSERKFEIKGLNGLFLKAKQSVYLNMQLSDRGRCSLQMVSLFIPYFQSSVSSCINKTDPLWRRMHVLTRIAFENIRKKPWRVASAPLPPPPHPLPAPLYVLGLNFTFQKSATVADGFKFCFKISLCSRRMKLRSPSRVPFFLAPILFSGHAG